MPIPQLDERGLLPPGIHTGTLEDVERQFSAGQYRELLWCDFIRFMREQLLAKKLSLPIYLGGSYFSDKPNPADIEVSVETRGAEDDQLGAAMRLYYQHDQLKSQYRVDYFPNLPGNSDFSEFFQYVGLKTAQTKGLNPKDRRGIIKVEAWTLG